MIFKRKPLHEKLAEAGGLVESADDDTWDHVLSARSLWDVVQGLGPNKASIHGVHRPREWDEVKTVEADVEGESARFVVLPNDDVVIEDGPDDVEPLADALTLEPPYRAESVRRGEGVWVVAARRIEMVELPGADGSELQLTRHGDDRTLVVDGERRFGSIPALEQPGNFTVSARRLDGDLWEIEASLL